jgi:hypothetical protein
MSRLDRKAPLCDDRYGTPSLASFPDEKLMRVASQTAASVHPCIRVF